MQDNKKIVLKKCSLPLTIDFCSQLLPAFIALDALGITFVPFCNEEDENDIYLKFRIQYDDGTEKYLNPFKVYQNE